MFCLNQLQKFDLDLGNVVLLVILIYPVQLKENQPSAQSILSAAQSIGIVLFSCNWFPNWTLGNTTLLRSIPWNCQSAISISSALEEILGLQVAVPEHCPNVIKPIVSQYNLNRNTV